MIHAFATLTGSFPSIESDKEVRPTLRLINSARNCRVSEWQKFCGMQDS